MVKHCQAKGMINEITLDFLMSQMSYYRFFDLQIVLKVNYIQIYLIKYFLETKNIPSNSISC